MNLYLLHLQHVDLDGRRAPEDADHDLELGLLRDDFLDRAGEGLEGAVDDLDLLARGEGLPRLRAARSPLISPERWRMPRASSAVMGWGLLVLGRADEAGDARDLA